MVECYVCGEPAAGGWICGVAPASDSLKLGLCREHDTPANREKVLGAWDDMMQSVLQRTMDVARETTKPAVRRRLRIYYLDGGVRTVECSHYEVTSDKQLLVADKAGKLEFYPLEHIKRFEAEDVPGEPPAPES